MQKMLPTAIKANFSCTYTFFFVPLQRISYYIGIVCAKLNKEYETTYIESTFFL